MAYSTIDRSSDYFRTKLYTGDGTTSRSITFDESKAMQPDFTWIKSRSNAYYHELYDVVRGFSSSTNGRVLYSNTTNAELTPNTFNSFNTNGFTVSLQSGEVGTNANGATFCAWNWKANGTGVSNTSGTITSTVSANTTSGFSVCTLTTNSGGSGSYGHGLGVAPSFIIQKSRTNAQDWYVYHKSLGASAWLELNKTNASTTGNTAVWSGTEPNSTVVNLGSGWTNANHGNVVAYCFADVKGYSKFGSYTGNGSTDGTFVYTGFFPAFVMIKETSGSGAWRIYDSKRGQGGDNIGGNYKNALMANVSDVEESGSTNNIIDSLSNGFKCRYSFDDTNGSGGSYIYMAFANSPFVSSKGIPTTAR